MKRTALSILTLAILTLAVCLAFTLASLSLLQAQAATPHERGFQFE